MCEYGTKGGGFLELKIGMRFYYNDECKQKKIIDKIISMSEERVVTEYFENGTRNTCNTSISDIRDKIERFGLASVWEGEFNYAKSRR